jgi:hypothetical protein
MVSSDDPSVDPLLRIIALDAYSEITVLLSMLIVSLQNSGRTVLYRNRNNNNNNIIIIII